MEAQARLQYHNGQKQVEANWAPNQVEVSMICGMIGWLRRSCRRACRSGAPWQNAATCHASPDHDQDELVLDASSEDGLC